MTDLDRETLARMIDHTKLSPQAGEKKIANLCREARAFGFYAVCINGSYVRFAWEKLQGSSVQVCTVVGFPLGASTSTAKACEASEAVCNGAAEIDMVIHIGALRDRRYDLVRDDIRAVVEAGRPALVKAILETCFLTDEEIVSGCRLAVEAGAKFVKTSTGFGTSGASADHVRLMRQTVGPAIGVKASGGIRHLRDARALIQAGASRLGGSASVAIIKELIREKLEKEREKEREYGKRHV
ncbi:MAG: deoxyribose-phosphate aldolase [Acidobacteriota bacterium]|jgi:deoxyribose-phosphate aldolase|nr:deoxyribose-phosphate aldolase [Acidobacteriota bacterium]